MERRCDYLISEVTEKQEPEYQREGQKASKGKLEQEDIEVRLLAKGGT